MLKLTEIQSLTGLTEPKDARNLADWLREARGERAVTKIDGEIAYDLQFVKDVLAHRFIRIQKKYPHAAQSVAEIIGETVTEPTQIHEIPNTSTPQTSEFTDARIEPTREQNLLNTNANREPENKTIDAPQLTDGVTGMHGQIQQTAGTGTASNSGNTVITEDPLRAALTSPRALLWATMFAILIFLPFTALNLWQYIAIKPESEWGKWAVFVLCWLIALIWDFSILLFAVNGKRALAATGAAVLFVFMASKFDFFRMLFDWFGGDGAAVQLGFVIFCIVSYTPLLLFQLTELAVKK